MKKSLALRYEPGLPAPFVNAKGGGRTAQRIEDLARASGVPVVRDEAAVEGLYPLELGDFIPEAYYKAIAGILAAVMRIEEGE